VLGFSNTAKHQSPQQYSNLIGEPFCQKNAGSGGACGLLSI
jgi:hypothetical protein